MTQAGLSRRRVLRSAGLLSYDIGPGRKTRCGFDMIRKQYIILSLTALGLIGCGDSSTKPVADRIVEGINFTELFAAPTQVEIAAIDDLWDLRDVSVSGYRVEATGSIDLDGTPGTVRIVSHVVDGNRHYGAIAFATDAAPQSLPVLVYSHGGDDGENIDNVFGLLNFGFGGIPDDYVYVVPSFRSEPLSYRNVTYTSEGQPSPWDRDIDDALALVNVAIESVDAADADRIGVVGFSRGACVGLLMAIRDPRIDLVVEFFGPTDFYSPFTQDVVEEALTGELRNLPGLTFLDEQFIQPLKESGITMAEMRSQILRRSPVYFADRLPDVQVHHGTSDQIVPVESAERLIEVMQTLGRGEPEFEAYIYQDGSHNPLSLFGSIQRTETFIERLLTSTLVATNVAHWRHTNENGSASQPLPRVHIEQ